MTMAVALCLASAGDGWFARNQVAARANPFGVFEEGRAGHRWALGSGRQFSLSGNASVSPAFARAGLSSELTVHPALSFFAIYEAGGMFGTFGLPQVFAASQGADWSEASRAGHPGFATPMQQLMLGAFVDLRAGRFIVRSNQRLVLEQLRLPSSQRVFYDQNWESLVANGGWLYVNDVDVLVQAVPGLRVGARWNVTHAFLGVTGDLTTHRAGPLVSWLLAEHLGGLQAPTLALVLNWWLQHPSRVGPVPYVGVAFTFKAGA